MTYSEKDIKILTAKEGIKKRPEMYFGSRGINAEDICTEIAKGALVLGSKSVQVSNIDDWWFICADTDWLNVSTKLQQINENSIFNSIYGFTELAENSFRWEALTKYFSDATYTTSKSGTKAVLINPVAEQEYEKHILTLDKWERIIGFKFNKNA